MDKLHRQWLMLTQIPVSPRKIDCATMEEHLREVGYQVSRRTIQRDLMKLAASKVFPLIYDDNSTPYGWSWARDGALFNIPSMGPHTALTFLLGERYLAGMLPPSTRASLRPYVENAGKVLDKLSGTELRTWPKKVRVTPRNFQLQPPEFREDVLEAVFEAVLRERKLALRYRRRGDNTPREYPEVNPLGLVFVDNLIYLVCTVGNHDTPLQFLLHRMEEATMLPVGATIPAGFTLKGYLDKGEFSYPTGEGTIRLKALFDREEAVYLFETRFPGEIKLEETSDGMVLLEAEVEDSYQLRRWLMGFGDGVEILEPQALRDDFREMAANLRRIYKRR
ncbi:WYL domain-containing protein [Geobacter sp.]|uniref:helix-turn-helix transcriptional regulator n=1 Tax=Geobacter sp. TaxID=46610 RepID=UPI00261CA81B|nr:WYL domain-containing protein [Geobacter sp.]